MRRSDYLIKRALFAIVTVFVAITITFFLFRVLPGERRAEPLAVPNATPELCSSPWSAVRPGRRSGSNT